MNRSQLQIQQTMPLEDEHAREWEIEYQTRIGMMCGSGKPTERQASEAARIADEHIARIKSQNRTA